MFAVNPREEEIEGVPSFPNLRSLPEAARGVSVITPPEVTAGVVEEAAELGIGRLWLQPGAEGPGVLRRAEELGLSVIAGGPCVLVVLGYRE